MIETTHFIRLLDLEFPKKNRMFLSIRNTQQNHVYVPRSFRAVSTAGTCIKVKAQVLNLLMASVIFF